MGGVKKRKKQDPPDGPIMESSSDDEDITKKYQVYKVPGYTRKYPENSKKTEFIVFLSHIDDKKTFSDKDRLAISHAIRKHCVTGILHLKSINKYKIGITFDLSNNANVFLQNKKMLDELGLKATIPAIDTEVTGVITSVPTDLSNKMISSLIGSSRNIIQVRRFMRRVRSEDGAVSYQPTPTVAVTFASTELPQYVYLDSWRHESNPIVTVKQGKLKGATENLIDGSTYYSFKGIPYAQPPIGKLRFKAPLSPKPWKGTYEAIEHGPVCPQLDTKTMQLLEGSENCLFLNVYTKSLQPHAKIPVMVFIHGGAYMSGSGDTDIYGPEFLLQHDVILVTINYRLEVLGFLCLDTAEVPGNAGMKDQVAALRWVRQNIAQFGGDPDNVTIFGESAGSASVTQHMISPMSKGLFHKAIAQSAVCLEDWAFTRDAKARAFRAGKYLGKETDDVNELLEFLQGVPALDLVNMTLKTRTPDEKFRGLPFFFVPVVEKSFHNVKAFLDEEPVEKVLAKKVNKVPLMIGYTSHEGLLVLNDRLKNANVYNNNPQYLVPRDIAAKISKEKREEFGDRILRFYTGDKGMSNETAEGIVDMQTDVNFAYNTHRFANFYSATNEPIFLYKFSFDTELNFVKLLVSPPTISMKGACHADDVFYLFYNEINKEVYEEKDYLKKIVFDVSKLWADFAKTGNPTPDNCSTVKWAPFTRTGKEYLNINEPMTPGHSADKNRVDFWDRIYCEAGAPCITKSTL